MAALEELTQFDAEVFRIETDTVWKGGVDGQANNQGKALANRTKWLKAQVEGLSAGKQDAAPPLAALAGLIGAVDKIAYFTGADALALTAFTAFARTLAAAADAAAARTALSAVSQDELTAALDNLANGAPGFLNQFNEFAAAIGNDPNFAATIINLLAGKGGLAVAQAWTAGQRGAVMALPATTGTITLDLALSNNWGGTLTGNIVLANPSSMPVGQSGMVGLTNDATPRTIAYGSYWQPANGSALDALTAVAGAHDVLAYYVESATRIVVGRIGGS